MKLFVDIIVAFVAMSITELIWTLYIHNIRDEKLVKAGLYNTIIFLSTSCATVLYMNNKWMIIPAAFGAFCGTYISKFFYKKQS